jgi:hypothetical protein
MSDLRFPIGKFELKAEITSGQRSALIESLAEAPARLRAAVEGLSPQQLGEPYRPEGWTLRQVAHHLPDSHLNGYTRFKLALTEVEPAIKTYEEKRWAELEDGRNADPEISLRLLESLHERWVILLRSLTLEDFGHTLKHPEWRVMSLDGALQLYEWHGRHHIAHITSLRRRKGW